MGGPERLVFDFDTNTWVRQGFLSETQELPDSRLVVPIAPPSPGRWNRPEKAPSKKQGAALALWGAAACVAVGVVLRDVGVAVPAAFMVAMAAALAKSKTPESRIITEADRRLLEDPEDLDVCLVSLKVVRRGQLVGEDRGAAWFADGLLLYSGHRTSFAIGGEDVLPQDRWTQVSSLFPNALGDLCVPLRVDRGTAHVELTPLIGNPGGSVQEMRFLKRLYAFRIRPPQSRGPRQWPPLEP